MSSPYCELCGLGMAKSRTPTGLWFCDDDCKDIWYANGGKQNPVLVTCSACKGSVPEELAHCFEYEGTNTFYCTYECVGKDIKRMDNIIRQHTDALNNRTAAVAAEKKHG